MVKSSNLVGIILTAEVSLDGSILIIGGSTNFDFSKGQAILQAINFNKKLSYITDITIGEKDHKFVSKVKRIDETDRFLVATSKSIFIYKFKNQLFSYISVIQNIFPGSQDSFVDMVIFENTLYAYCADSKFVNRIEFACN